MPRMHSKSQTLSLRRVGAEQCGVRRHIGVFPVQILEVRMPKFITIGYGDRKDYERTPKRLRDAAHEQDERLRKSGALIGIAGNPVQVRNHEARSVRIDNGPYMASQLPIAGFAVIEAS